MIKNDFAAHIFGFGIFYRWHPAIALRYLPLVERIKKMGNTGSILEVGSGGLGIAPYLKREVTGIDIDFKPPFHPLLKRRKGSATKLPYDDSSFDMVLSVDMLEHLKKTDRDKTLREMIRVAKENVFIGVPMGSEAEKEDRMLHEYYKDKFGKSYKYFQEQINEGLPKKEEMYKMITDAAGFTHKKITIQIMGNENISLHNFLMKGWMSQNFLVDIFFRKFLLFAVPLLRALDRPPYYRQLFFVQII